MRRALSIFLLFIVVVLSAFSPNQVFAKPRLAPPPSITSLSPAAFAAGVNIPVTITGTNLENITSAALGTTGLTNIQAVDSTHFTALVPWSILPGVYTLSVTNNIEETSLLPGAATVSPAQTGWASNGPYGGDLTAPSLDPQNPNRLYVAAQRSGVFYTTDGAASWKMELVAPFPNKVHFVYPNGSTTPVMYMEGGAGVNGLQRSTDNGVTWVQKMPDGYNTWTSSRGIDFRAAVDSALPGRVYLALSSWWDTDPEMGLYISDNQGDTWTRATATNGLHVVAVAVEPGNPTHVVIGTKNGDVLTSINGGATWSSPVHATDDNLSRIVISPTIYNAHRKIWAIINDDVVQSTDGGVNWTHLQIQPGLFIYDIEYHPTIPGLIWSAAGGGYFSTDDGDTWTALNAGLGELHEFEIVPGSLNRGSTTLYLATEGGMYKSTNGGDTWIEVNQGLGAALPGAIITSPFNADEAYAAVKGKGLLRTLDGGQNWNLLSIPNDYYRPGMAADPFTAGKFYFSSGDYQEHLAIYTTTDHGNSYSVRNLTLPPALSGRWAAINAIAAHPTLSGHLLAGVCMSWVTFPDPTEGLVYASSDGGLNWVVQTTPSSARCVNSLTYDPQNPMNVYAGTEGGLLVSTDGGANWAIPTSHPDLERVGPVVVDPRDSQSVYLFGGPNFNGGGGGDVGTFASHDGGATWQKLEGLQDYPVWGLKFVPVDDQYWLYAATMNGLRFLRDVPAGPFDPLYSWEKSSGIAGAATVDAFNAGVETGRVVYYIGSSGGVLENTPLPDLGSLAAPAGSENVPGGVYRRLGFDTEIAVRNVPGWNLANDNGFRISSNVISAMEVFGGQLYAGASNWNNGGSVHRSANGADWTQVSALGMDPLYGSTNPAILDLAAFKDQLYASVGWGMNEGQIWRTANGTDWTKVTGSEFGDPSNRSVSVMIPFDEMLYAFSTGSVEVWRSASGDAGDWDRVEENGFGNPKNVSVNGAAVFLDHLYVNVANGTDGASVWRTPDGINWTQVNTNGFGIAGTTNVGGMAVLGTSLYAGVFNATTGGQIWRYDGSVWSQVVSDGFGDTHNIVIDSLFTVQNHLYAVTSNSNTGLQVWRSANGTNWSPLNLDGFGTPNNGGVLWSNSTTTFAGKYFVGTWNGVDGGEIWQYAGFPSYLPLLRR